VTSGLEHGITIVNALKVKNEKKKLTTAQINEKQQNVPSYIINKHCLQKSKPKVFNCNFESC